MSFGGWGTVGEPHRHLSLSTLCLELPYPQDASRGRRGASQRWAGRPRTRAPFLPPNLPCPLCHPRPPVLTRLWADQSQKQPQIWTLYCPEQTAPWLSGPQSPATVSPESPDAFTLCIGFTLKGKGMCTTLSSLQSFSPRTASRKLPTVPKPKTPTASVPAPSGTHPHSQAH